MLIVTGDSFYHDREGMVEQQNSLHGVPGSREQDKKLLDIICIQGPTRVANYPQSFPTSQSSATFKSCVTSQEQAFKL